MWFRKPGVIFKWFLGIRSLGLLADQIALLVIPVVIYMITQDVVWSGLAVLVQWLPRILGLPFLGGLIDRWKIKAQYVVIDAIRAGVSLSLVWLDDPALLMAMAGLLSLLNGYAFLILEYTVATQLDKDNLARNQSWLQVIENTTRVSGPAVGGILLAWGDIDLVMIICSALFGVAALMASFGFPPKHKVELLVQKQGVLESFNLILSSKPLMRLTGLTMGTNFVEGAVAALLPALILTQYGYGPEMVGYLNGVGALCVIVFMAICSPWVSRWNLVLVGGLAVGLSSAMVVFMALEPHFVVFFILYIGFILTRSLFILYLRTERIKHIPTANLGQVLGLMISLILCTVPLSGGIVAILSNWLVTNMVLLFSVGGAMLIYGLSWLLTSRKVSAQELLEVKIISQNDNT